jgi:hypothetical protein
MLPQPHHGRQVRPTHHRPPATRTQLRDGQGLDRTSSGTDGMLGSIMTRVCSTESLALAGSAHDSNYVCSTESSPTCALCDSQDAEGAVEGKGAGGEMDGEGTQRLLPQLTVTHVTHRQATSAYRLPGSDESARLKRSRHTAITWLEPRPHVGSSVSSASPGDKDPPLLSSPASTGDRPARVGGRAGPADAAAPPSPLWKGGPRRYTRSHGACTCREGHERGLLER